MSEKEPTKKRTTVSKATEVPQCLPAIPSLLLVNSKFETIGGHVDNFIGIPLNENSPFVEVVFDPEKKILGLISKIRKPQYQFIAKLDGNGFPKPINNPKLAEATGRKFVQERVLTEVYHEYYLIDKKDIETFLKIHVVETGFNWMKFLK